MNEFVLKPIKLVELAALVNRLLPNDASGHDDEDEKSSGSLVATDSGSVSST